MNEKIETLKQGYKKAVKKIKFAYNKIKSITKLSKTPYYSRLLSLTKKRTLKRSKSGFEIEHILIDNNGKISNKSEEIIKAVNKKHPKLNISKEVGKEMIEIRSFPSLKVQNTALNLIHNTIKVMETLEKHENLIFPFACYPGKFNVQIHNIPRYELQAKIFGEELFKATSGSLCGFHFHYTMPRGVFDYDKLFLRRLVRSKIKHSFIECYNMLIAMDPALTTFMQSSPFINNKYFAKDSRVIMYRGGKKLEYMGGLYSKYQLLGGLPPYKHTIYDLKLSLRKKNRKWREILEKKNIRNQLLKDKIILDYIWNPVKVNKIGTLEQRGMDSNYISYVISSAVLIKYILRAIQQDFLVVWPSDIGIDEPFKVEGNVVYIPPHSYVRNKLQKYAAYEGISNKKVYFYSKRFFNFAKKLMHKRYSNVIRPIEDIIEYRRTVSDVIINQVKRAGYSLNDTLTQEFVQNFAVKSADNFKKDIYKTEKIVANLD